jgi:DNA-binding transcriptional LysR family regulator
MELTLRLEIRHVRVLLAVAEEGSLVRAARRLGIPQPSLSTQLRRIERAVDAELFHRSSRGAALTDAGRELLPHLQAVDEHMKRVESGAAGTGAASVVPIRVGVECRALLDVLVSGRGGHAERPWQLGLSGPPATEAALLDGGFDMVQTTATPAAQLPHPFRTAPALTETIGVLVPPGDELTSRPYVRLADLADREWVSSLPGTAWHEELIRVAAAGGFRPRVCAVATSEAAVADMAVRAGALALGTMSSAARGPLRLRRLDQRFTRRMVVAWNSVTVSDHVVAGFLTRIRDWRANSTPRLAVPA